MAGGFSEQWLNKVRDANDIVGVISSYVNLNPKGKRYWGNCPFHHEKTPSFSVSPDKQMYYCFGCHAGGNVFTFISEIEKLNFMEAAKFLAERAGIALEEVNNEEYIKQRAKNERLYSLNKLAARFFFENLRKPEAADAARYLKRRGLDEKIVTQFGLGFAFDKRDQLVKLAQDEGYTASELVSAGLAIERDGRLMDMFRNRIIFPIINHYGKVIAFGGRVMDDSKPKYLNSPDTPIYNKRRNLYAANIVKKKSNIDKVILVEGYMDVISLHQYGYDCAVASLGTALTPEQVALIRRMTQNIYITYDGDSAGRNATMKALTIIRTAGANAKVVSLPDMDPDDFIKQKGKLAFDELLSDAKNEVDYKIGLLENEVDLSTHDGKKTFAIKASSVLKLISDPVELDDKASGISVISGFAKDIILKQAEKSALSSQSGEEFKEPEIKNAVLPSKNDWHVIRIIMSSGELFDDFVSAGGAELLEDEMCRDIFKFLINRKENGEKTTDQDVLNEFSNSVYSKDVSALLFSDQSYAEPARYLNECIARIKLDRVKKERRELSEKLVDTMSSDPQKSIEILQKIKELDIFITNSEKV